MKDKITIRFSHFSKIFLCFTCKLIAILAVFLSGALYANAQSAQYLLIPADAVSSAMGGVSIGVRPDAFSIFNNTAALVFTENKISAGVSFSNWQPENIDSKLYGFGLNGKLNKRMGLGIGVRYMSYPSFDIYDKNGNINGSMSPREFDINLGYAVKITDYLSGSLTLRYISSDPNISDNADIKRASAFSADLGLMFSKNCWNFGIAYTNLGSDLNYGYNSYDLPSVVKIGGSYILPFGKSKLVPTVEVNYLTGRNCCISAGMGAEFKIIDIVAIRAGYHFGDKEKTIPNYASAGLGINFLGIALDISYLAASSDSPLKNTMCFSLGYKF